MNTEKLREMNTEKLIELTNNIFALVQELEEIKEEEERKEAINLILNSLSIIRWNITTL